VLSDGGIALLAAADSVLLLEVDVTGSVLLGDKPSGDA